jgi:hypothetical protein
MYHFMFGFADRSMPGIALSAAPFWACACSSILFSSAI